jgi:hypothetical protein
MWEFCGHAYKHCSSTKTTESHPVKIRLSVHTVQWSCDSSHFTSSAYWEWVTSFTTQPLYPRVKSPIFPRAGGRAGPQPIWMLYKNKFYLPGIEPQFLCLWVRMLVTVLTETSQLLPWILFYFGASRFKITTTVMVTSLRLPYNRPWMPIGEVQVHLYFFFNFITRWRWVVNATPQPRKKTQYTLYSRRGRPQGRSRRVRKISPAPEFEPRTVQLIAIRYPGPRWCLNNATHMHLQTLNRKKMETRKKMLAGL